MELRATEGERGALGMITFKEYSDFKLTETVTLELSGGYYETTRQTTNIRNTTQPRTSHPTQNSQQHRQHPHRQQDSTLNYRIKTI